VLNFQMPRTMANVVLRRRLFAKISLGSTRFSLRPDRWGGHPNGMTTTLPFTKMPVGVLNRLDVEVGIQGVLEGVSLDASKIARPPWNGGQTAN
jgi:hypothetical protein